MADTHDGAPRRHRLQHVRIERFRSETVFSPPRRDMSKVRFTRDRDIHGAKLTGDLAAAFSAAHDLLSARDPRVQAGTAGVYLEVESAKDARLPDLDWPSQDIRLGAVRIDKAGVEVGTLFVPEPAEGFLALKVEEYAHQSTPKQKPKHEAKFAPVETFRAATVESLWTDQRPFPADLEKRIWWECWCWEERAPNLDLVAQRLNLRKSVRRLYFPELVVIPRLRKARRDQQAPAKYRRH